MVHPALLVLSITRSAAQGRCSLDAARTPATCATRAPSRMRWGRQYASPASLAHTAQPEPAHRCRAPRAHTPAIPTSRASLSARPLTWATMRQRAALSRQCAAPAQSRPTLAWARASSALRVRFKMSLVRLPAKYAHLAHTAQRVQQLLFLVRQARGAAPLALLRLGNAWTARLVQPAARELPGLRSATPAPPRARQECPLASCVSLASTSLIPTQQHASFAWRPAIAPVMARPRQHHVPVGPIRM